MRMRFCLYIYILDDFNFLFRRLPLLLSPFGVVVGIVVGFNLNFFHSDVNINFLNQSKGKHERNPFVFANYEGARTYTNTHNNVPCACGISER